MIFVRKIHAIYITQAFRYNSDRIRLKEESHNTYALRVSKLWGNFHFWVNYPLKF